VISRFRQSRRELNPLDAFLMPARERLLRNLLRFFIVIGGVACSVAVSTYVLQGVYPLALFYGLFYCGFVVLARWEAASFAFKRLLPIVLLTVLLAVEYTYFGSTPFSNTLIYALVVFTGLMYGIGVALAALSIGLVVVGARAWQGYYFTPQVDFPTDFPSLLSPIISQFGLIAMTVAAIYVMFRQMQQIMADKHELIEHLQKEIEDREKAQAALKLSEEQFDQLFQHSNDAVIFVDRESDSIVLANRAAERLTSLDAETLKHQRLADLVRDNHSRFALGESESDSVDLPEELVFSREDGELRPAQVSSSIVEGGLRFLMLRDITERKKLEEQVAQAHKMEAVGQLAGGIAHDFNNSLQVIIGFCELAQLKIQGGPGSEEIAKVYDSGKRSQHLVAQLLAFSRRQQLETRPLDLNEATEESLHLVRRLLGENIQLKFDGAEQSLMIHGDRNQIEQALLNLCINARDAINDNGTLRIGLGEALMTAQFCKQHPWAQPGSYACLTVADTGCGMPDNVREKVFEPFFTTKQEGKGTGLGLSSVLGIVQQHDGFVHLDSETGHGTTIDVYFPLIEQAPQPVTSAQADARLQHQA